MEQAQISKVRASVHRQRGNRVKIQLDRGRNKVDIQEGVIQGAYPSVFTILVDDEREEILHSYCHSVTLILLQRTFE